MLDCGPNYKSPKVTLICLNSCLDKLIEDYLTYQMNFCAGDTNWNVQVRGTPTLGLVINRLKVSSPRETSPQTE